MGQGDGKGHELGGLVAGKAHHHSLVTSAQCLDLILAVLFSGLQRFVYPHGDIL